MSAAAASMRFLSCFTCRPVQVAVVVVAASLSSSRWSLLCGGVDVPITPKVVVVARCAGPIRMKTRVTKAATERTREGKREIGRRKRELRATAHSIRESSMKGLCFMLRC